jgi:MFS family permease
VGALYFFGGWMFGLVWTGILSALRDPDEVWQSRTRRGCFVLGVALMLGVTAVIVAASNGPHSPNPSRESIWIYCLGCAVPVTILAFFFARSALVHPVVGAFGTLLAVLVLAASGEAFRAYGQPLDGLAATAHDNHGFVVAALLVPLLVITLACLPLRKAGAVETLAQH